MTHTEKTKVLHEFNFNDNVEVVLTEQGAKVLNEYNHKCMAELRAIPSCRLQLRVDYIAGETYTQQLWAMFKLFGPGTKIGMEAPFQECKMSLISYV